LCGSSCVDTNVIRLNDVVVATENRDSGTAKSNDSEAANQAAANAAQPKKKAAYCFFKDSETKDWAASRGKDGNIVVKGKAFRSDPRYQALLGEPTVTGSGITARCISVDLSGRPATKVGAC